MAGARDTRGTWYGVVRDALQALGGEADLDQIYRAVQPKCPSTNPHWMAQIRKVIQHPRRFQRTGPARYRHLGGAQNP